MNLSTLFTLISVATAVAGGFGVAWEIQASNITQIRLEQANERIAIQRQARATLERNMSAVSAAQVQAKSRNKRLGADRVSAADSGNGLRSASAATSRAAAGDSAACDRALAAHDLVLSEGIEFIHEVAGTADQCLSDNQALTESWPK